MFTPSEEDDRVGRWLRRGLFLLILIVLLVWLASQTLLPDGDDERRIAYSDAKALVGGSPDDVARVLFEPKKNGLELRMTDGRILQTYYPVDESAVAFEELLDENAVAYDSRSRGDSAWWSFLTYLLPFVLFFGFWIFLMRSVQRAGWTQKSTSE
jgi:cell division protease FtsH